MSFSLSGSTITQTGTDTTVAGLSGVAGVTTFSFSGKTIFNVNNLNLQIDGTLTFDPQNEEIWFGSVSPFPCFLVRNGGTLNIGVDITSNSVRFYPFVTAARINRPGTTSWDDSLYSSLRVVTGGTINHYYGTFYVRAPVGLGETANSASGIYRSYSKAASFISLGTANDGFQPQIRMRSTQTDINGLTVRGLNSYTLIGNASRQKDIDLYHLLVGIGPSGSAPSNVWLKFENYSSAGGNSIDIGLWQGKWMSMRNCINGSQLIVDRNDPAQNFNTGLVRVVHDLTINASTTSGTAITSGGWAIRDRNWGNRLAANQIGTNSNLQTDATYFSTFNSSGVASLSGDDTAIVTSYFYRTNGTGSVPGSTADRRCETNDSSDRVIARVRSYGFYSQEITAILKGAGGNTVNTTLFTNTDISVPYSTAVGYSGITLTDHGGSPVSWNGKNYGITITGNLNTNPSLNPQMIHDYLQSVIHRISTTIDGKLGGEWHDMVYKSGSNFGTVLGSYGGTRVVKGVRVIDQDGNSFPGFNSMQADDGTYYIPPIQYSLTITGIDSSSEIRIIRQSDLVELGGVETVGSSSWAYNYTYTSDIPIFIVIFSLGYAPIRQAFTLVASNSTLPITQIIDRQYNNP